MRTEKLTSKFQQALSNAQSLAVGRDHQFIEPAHLMLALLYQEGGTVRPLLAQQRQDHFISSELFVLAAMDSKCNLSELLRKAACERKAVEQAIDALRGGQNVDDHNAEEQRQALEKNTIDLTERAEQGKLDPVISWNRPWQERFWREYLGRGDIVSVDVQDGELLFRLTEEEIN